MMSAKRFFARYPNNLYLNVFGMVIGAVALGLIIANEMRDSEEHGELARTVMDIYMRSVLSAYVVAAFVYADRGPVVLSLFLPLYGTWGTPSLYQASAAYPQLTAWLLILWAALSIGGVVQSYAEGRRAGRKAN